ncbi:MAG: antibiotic biosynthesis monooxygenase family protein [Nocardioides sp.]|uniref:putative quinol monooxygenase n=1 Tax=Nocardioides sp. TaxID=35761 RepID=UPI0039E2B248
MTEVVVVHYRARAGLEDEVANALRAMTPLSNAEPGCLLYRVYRSPDEPAEFTIVEEYADPAAAQAHRDSPHFAEHLLGRVLPALDDRVRHDLRPLEP